MLVGVNNKSCVICVHKTFIFYGPKVSFTQPAKDSLFTLTFHASSPSTRESEGSETEEEYHECNLILVAINQTFIVSDPLREKRGRHP